VRERHDDKVRFNVVQWRAAFAVEAGSGQRGRAGTREQSVQKRVESMWGKSGLRLIVGNTSNHNNNFMLTII